MTQVRTPTATFGRLAGRLAAPAAALAAIAGATAYVAAHDPNRPGHYPACPLLMVTGLYCPGCGGLRATHALAHGDPATALGSNALALAGFLVFAGFWVWWCVRAVRTRPVTLPVRPVHLWLAAGLAVAFTVVRNLPFGSALAP